MSWDVPVVAACGFADRPGFVAEAALIREAASGGSDVENAKPSTGYFASVGGSFVPAAERAAGCGVSCSSRSQMLRNRTGWP